MTYVPWLGLLLTALGTAAGYYYFRRQNARINLDIIYSSQKLIADAEKEGLGGSLRVSYKDRPVEDPRIVVLKIINSSPKDLESKSFDQGRPIKLSIEGSSIIAEGFENPASKSTLVCDIDPNGITIGPDLIRSGAEHTITVIVDGAPKVVMKELRLINCDVELRKDEQFRQKRWVSAPVLMLAPLVLSVLVTVSFLAFYRVGNVNGNERDPLSAAGVDIVIQRAKSQLDTPYAWGGGDLNGPTLGIRDGGVADSFKDYEKVGFDASGLMVYAFGGFYRLPHYSGYQYTSENGIQVPFEERRAGDMIFYGPNASRHVALYLGDDLMIEAYRSGQSVKISPVREEGVNEYVVRPLSPE